MKKIDIWFDNEEYDEVTALKDELKMTWRKFILELVREKTGGLK